MTRRHEKKKQSDNVEDQRHNNKLCCWFSLLLPDTIPIREMCSLHRHMWVHVNTQRDLLVKQSHYACLYNHNNSTESQFSAYRCIFCCCSCCCFFLLYLITEPKPNPQIQLQGMQRHSDMTPCIRNAAFMHLLTVCLLFLQQEKRMEQNDWVPDMTMCSLQRVIKG